MSVLLRPLLVVLAFVVLVVVLIVFVFAGGDDDGDKKASEPAVGTVSAKDLKVGNCIGDANSTQGDVRTFDAVDCAKPHDGEVFTIIGVAGAKYPGTMFVTGKGQRGCRARLRRQATPKAFKDKLLGYKFVYPTKQSWAQGDHEVTCLATFKKPRTGKLVQRTAGAS
jgi:hypothetical protein